MLMAEKVATSFNKVDGAHKFEKKNNKSVVFVDGYSRRVRCKDFLAYIFEV